MTAAPGPDPRFDAPVPPRRPGHRHRPRPGARRGHPRRRRLADVPGRAADDRPRAPLARCRAARGRGAHRAQRVWQEHPAAGPRRAHRAGHGLGRHRRPPGRGSRVVGRPGVPGAAPPPVAHRRRERPVPDGARGLAARPPGGPVGRAAWPRRVARGRPRQAVHAQRRHPAARRHRAGARARPGRAPPRRPSARSTRSPASGSTPSSSPCGSAPGRRSCSSRTRSPRRCSSPTGSSCCRRGPGAGRGRRRRPAATAAARRPRQRRRRADRRRDPGAPRGHHGRRAMTSHPTSTATPAAAVAPAAATAARPARVAVDVGWLVIALRGVARCARISAAISSGGAVEVGEPQSHGRARAARRRDDPVGGKEPPRGIES